MSKSTPRRIKADIEQLLPNIEVRTLFDVGANVGQTVMAMRPLFPEAKLYAFEPVRASYEQLLDTAGNFDDTECFNLALSDANSAATMLARGTSQNNRIVEQSGSQTEEVSLISGDIFCEEHGIDHIDYLKIDTEGHEMQVLRGLQSMLSDYRVDLIELEAGMNWGNKKHTPFEHLKGYLEPMGYYLFRFYEQVAEKRGRPHLRRVNVVFISQPTVEGNIRVKKEVSA